MQRRVVFTLDHKLMLLAFREFFVTKKIFFMFHFSWITSIVLSIFLILFLKDNWRNIDTYCINGDFFLNLLFISMVFLLTFYVLYFFALTAIVVFLIRFRAKHYSAKKIQAIWVFDDENLNIANTEISTNIETSSQMPFRIFEKWVETKNFIRLHYTRVQFLTFPKNSMSEDELADFRAILQSQIQKR